MILSTMLFLIYWLLKDVEYDFFQPVCLTMGIRGQILTSISFIVLILVASSDNQASLAERVDEFESCEEVNDLTEFP